MIEIIFKLESFQEMNILEFFPSNIGILTILGNCYKEITEGIENFFVSINFS